MNLLKSRLFIGWKPGYRTPWIKPWLDIAFLAVRWLALTTLLMILFSNAIYGSTQNFG